MSPTPSWTLGIRVASLAAALWSLVPTAASWLMVHAAADEWGAEHAALAGIALSVLSIIVCSALGCAAVSLFRRTPPAFICGPVAQWACAAACFAPALTRLFLPLEDPKTGMGSPMASMFSVIILAGASGVVFALPTGLIASLVTKRWLVAQREFALWAYTQPLRASTVRL